MDNNRFFKWIWRLNSIIILILLLVLGYFITKDLIKGFTTKSQDIDFIENIVDNPNSTENWTFANQIEVVNSNTLILPLISDRQVADIPRSIYPADFNLNYTNNVSQNNPAKNVLFFNAKNNEGRWLFNDVNRIIFSIREFPPYYRNNNKSDKPIVIIYQLIKVDTNNNGVIDINDQWSLAASDLEGRAFKILLEHFDHIVSINMTDNNELLVMFQIKGIGYSSLFDLSTLKKISERQLPKIGG